MPFTLRSFARAALARLDGDPASSPQPRAARADNWLNLLTGTGINYLRTAFGFTKDSRLPDDTLEDLYHQDPYAGRIARVVPTECLRQGFTVQTGDPAVDAALARRLADLRAPLRLARAWTWARVFGGGAVFVGADDGRDPREPLDLGAVRSIRFLVDLDRRELIPSWWYADPLNPKFGQVEVYRLARIGGVNVDTREVHESRLLRFEGQLVTRRRAITLQGWGESELQRVYADLQQFRGAFAACATLLQDASQGVFAIKDLFTMMAGDRQDALKKRLELMDLARSVGRSVMIDADGERFERVEVGALSGVAEAMQLFLLLLSGASEIPVTLLMGQAPAGLSATGDSDIRTFYDRMRTEQQATLDPQLQRLVRLLLVAQDGPTGGREPASWKITYAPLWQETPGEKADNRLKIAQADQIYLTTGVLLPEEVAISRFGPGDEDRELTIDVSARQAALEAEQAEARTQGAAPAGQGEGPALEAPPAAQDAAPEEETHREPFKAPGLPPPPSNPGGSLWVPPPQRGGPAPGYTGVPEGEPGTGGERT